MMEELTMIFQTFSREEVKPQENDGQSVPPLTREFKNPFSMDKS